MKVSMQKVRDCCADQRIGIGAALAKAGVSRNAFYFLARKDSVIPGSLRALAATLDVSVSDLLETSPTPVQRMIDLANTALRISDQCRAGLENVRHTLLLLDEQPVERLRRALQRGRQLNLR